MTASIHIQLQVQIQVSSATTLACWNSILTTKNYNKQTTVEYFCNFTLLCNTCWRTQWPYT